MLHSGSVPPADAYPAPAPMKEEWPDPSQACNGAAISLSQDCLLIALLVLQAYKTDAYRHPIA